MEATMLLCDHAQVANEKLYVLGGGWKHVSAPDTPFPAALAVLLEIPWTATNEKHELTMQLVDDDGNQIEQKGMPVFAQAQFEVGRPVGVKPGTALNQPMVFKFDGMTLAAGGYVFELSVDGSVLARAPFRVGIN
jgi:hypothetical protein